MQLETDPYAICSPSTPALFIRDQQMDSMRACADLTAFADGELAWQAHPRFRRHLASCQQCQTDLETAMILDALVSTLAVRAARAPARMAPRSRFSQA